jgi:hypothetical protein
MNSVQDVDDVSVSVQAPSLRDWLIAIHIPAPDIDAGGFLQECEQQAVDVEALRECTDAELKELGFAKKATW